MNVEDFPVSYRAQMINAYPNIAKMPREDAYYATPDEKDAAFQRILDCKALRRTHEMFLDRCP